MIFYSFGRILLIGTHVTSGGDLEPCVVHGQVLEIAVVVVLQFIRSKEEHGNIF